MVYNNDNPKNIKGDMSFYILVNHLLPSYGIKMGFQTAKPPISNSLLMQFSESSKKFENFKWEKTHATSNFKTTHNHVKIRSEIEDWDRRNE